MIESWQTFLYPLGFLSALAFGARFIVQWLKSEVRKKSIVPPAFWKLSLTGNLLLFFHSLIQMQFHVCIIQVINGVISWRNLNLMKASKSHLKTQSVLILLFLLLIMTTVIFCFLGVYFNDAWFRIPLNNWTTTSSSTGLVWHIFGFIGLILFNSRFWIQWWHAEKTQTSSLGRSFWWLSLAGALFSIAYFARIQDPVNLIGPAIGIVPYIRNLMLLYRSKSTETAVE